MIEKLKFKFGSSQGQPNLEIDVTPITVFVGPNNSGKSRILIEIENYSRRGHGQSNDLVLSDLNLIPYTKDNLEKELLEIEQQPNVNENVGLGSIVIGKINPQQNQAVRFQVHKQYLTEEALNPNSKSATRFAQLLSLYTLRLDGTNRLNLLNEQNAGDLQNTPLNSLSHLFIDNILRKEVRRIVYEAFGRYYVIDPTNIGKLRVRLSEREPVNEREEKGWENDAVNFHKAAVEIINASDGVKAFCGIITTLLAGDPKITLIDEPEAFLHPALANKLGNEIGKSLRNTQKRFFASTHSSSFLMGCIQSNSSVNIVRLTYKNNVPTARVLPKEKILHLMRHPLLRSTNVLNGLFYESVIVTEADSDRAFYQEINERLLAVGDPRGINNCLFINAQNKQTIWEIVKPLRELGIPTVGIVDIDVIKEGGQVFAKPLEGAYIPSISHQSLQAQRNSILNAFKTIGIDMKRNDGIHLLIPEEQEACNNFFDQIQEYGVFVIRQGELESWLKYLGATGHGSSWLIDIFEKMGENPDNSSYTRPTDCDVWEFIGEIKSWVENPKRKGIPQ